MKAGKNNLKRAGHGAIFPAFETFYRTLLLVAFICPLAAAAINWIFVDSIKASAWFVGLLSGTVLATVSVVIVWVRARRLHQNLTDTVRWVRAANRGALGGRLPIEERDEFAELKRSVNEMAAQLIVAQEATSDRRFSSSGHRCAANPDGCTRCPWDG